MKDLSNNLQNQATPMNSVKAPNALFRSKKKLAGFPKILAAGRVVNLDASKSFLERFVGCQEAAVSSFQKNASRNQVVLETVVANLEAGVQLIEMQELSLAKFGGRLAEIALSLNKAREYADRSQEAQSEFEQSRHQLRSIAKETFDHTALFSNGPAKPITLVIPTRTHWEGLSIQRLNLSQPGLLSIDRGKVCPEASGLLLDSESVQRAFNEWRSLCLMVGMQSVFFSSKLHIFVEKLKGIIGGMRWEAPPLPNDDHPGPIQRPNLYN